MSEVRPEWYAFTALRETFVTNVFSRLLDYAGNYFDLSTFPDGETKRALQRIVNKRSGKFSARIDGKDDRKAKKQKGNH